MQIDGKPAFMYYVSPTQINVLALPTPCVVDRIGRPGLYQINVTVPAGLPVGDNSIVAPVAGASTQSNALLKIVN